MKELGIIAGYSVSHDDATVDQIEAVSSPTEETVASLLERGPVEEAFAISTCNRFEAYVVTESKTAGQTALDPLFAAAPAGVVRTLGHEETLRHLMRVAAGLESLVVGEDQIIGQVRTAYESADEAGGIGPLLDDALVKALRVGERARTETAINEGIVSLGSAAVEQAARSCDLAEASGLVIGAGEMGALTAAALAEAVDDLVVANRTSDEAEQVVCSLDTDARAVGLDSIEESLADADVVISATASPDHVLDESDLAAAGELLIIDIGQPRDVAPAVGEIEGITVHDLDTLASVTAETHAKRQEAAETVERIIDEELDRLLAGYKRQRADQVIAAMYEGAERVKEAEIQKARTQLEAAESPGERTEVLESLADAIVGQLLAAPTNSLRDAAQYDDWETIHTALTLFDPRIDVGTDDLPESMADGIPPAVVEKLTDD